MSIFNIVSLLLVVCLCSYAYGLGDTPETIETLKFRYANDYRGLIDWSKKNLKYSLTNSRVLISPKKFIDTKEGDCEEFAFLYKEVLSAGNKYQPVIIAIFKGGEFPNGHFVCAIRDHGDVVLLSNQGIIPTTCKTLKEVNETIFPESEMRMIT